MTYTEIHQHLIQAFPDAELTLEETQPEPVCRLKPASLEAVARVLREDPVLNFECLMCLSGLDKGEELQTVYHLYSMKHHHRFTLRCAVPKDEAEIPSVSEIWPTAEWHEREAYDLVGIRFSGLQDHRRILCPDDWEGHPLRKDYKAPESFHDIPLTAILPSELQK